MPRSDDPIEQIRQQRKDEQENLGVRLARRELGKIPFVDIAIDFVRDKEKAEKEEWFDNAVLDILKDHEVSIELVKKKLKSENLKRLISAAVEEMFWGASKTKVKRFAAVVAEVIESDKAEREIGDAIGYIRSLDELSDDDIRVLKFLYEEHKDLVLENHHVDYNRFFYNYRADRFFKNATNLEMQMDEFYARCARLNSYGLVLPLERNSNFDPSQYMFRMTILGRRLIEMLEAGGEITNIRPED